MDVFIHIAYHTQYVEPYLKSWSWRKFYFNMVLKIPNIRMNGFENRNPTNVSPMNFQVDAATAVGTGLRVGSQVTVTPTTAAPSGGGVSGSGGGGGLKVTPALSASVAPSSTTLASSSSSAATVTSSPNKSIEIKKDSPAKILPISAMSGSSTTSPSTGTTTPGFITRSSFSAWSEQRISMGV